MKDIYRLELCGRVMARIRDDRLCRVLNEATRSQGRRRYHVRWSGYECYSTVFADELRDPIGEEVGRARDWRAA